MARARSRLAIFDFDGTLVDSKDAIAAALNAVLARRWRGPVAVDAIHRRIGLSLERIVHELTGEAPGSAAFVAVTDGYRDAVRQGALREVRVFAGIEPLLARLGAMGIVCAIATGKSAAGLAASLEHTGLARFFATWVTGDRVTHAKPHPEMVEHVLAATGCAAADALVIGDTPFDVAMGRAAGARTCGVSYGSYGRADLAAAGPDHLVDRVEELHAVLVDPA